MSDSQYMRKVLDLFEDIAGSGKTIDSLTPESIQDFYQKNGFVSFTHNNETWIPKSASGRMVKDGGTKVIYSWTTIGGDAAYEYARVQVNGATNQVEKGYIKGGAEYDGDKASKEQAKEAAKAKYFPLIADALNNNPAIKAHVAKFSSEKKEAGDPEMYINNGRPYDANSNYGSGMDIMGVTKNGDVKIRINPGHIMGTGLSKYSDNPGLVSEFDLAISKIPGFKKLARSTPDQFGLEETAAFFEM